MATIIDSLVVSLGLDSSAFVEGQKQAVASFTKTKDASLASAKEIEASGKIAAEFFGRLRNSALEFFAILAGATGLRDFLRDTTASEIATGNLARNLQMSSQELSAWQGAAKMAGGSTEGMASSLHSFMQQIQQLSLTGQSSIVPYLRLLQQFGNGSAIALADATGKARPLGDIMLDIAGRLKAIADTGQTALAESIGAGLGLDPNTVIALERGRSAWLEYLDAARKAGGPTKADTAAGLELSSSFYLLQRTVTTVARDILTAVTPAIVDLLTKFKDWITANKQWIETGIVGALKDFGTYIKSIDWASVGAGIKNFAKDMHELADAIGGVKRALEILIALWASSKVAGMLASLAVLLRMTKGAPAAAGAAPAAAPPVTTPAGAPAVAPAGAPAVAPVAAESLAGSLMRTLGLAGLVAGVFGAHDLITNPRQMPIDAEHRWLMEILHHVTAPLASIPPVMPDAAYGGALMLPGDNQAAPGLGGKFSQFLGSLSGATNARASTQLAAASAPAAGRNVTVEVSFGPVSIQTAATDANGIASRLAGATKDALNAALANRGLV